MREIYEFRVNEDFASRLFPDNEGKKLGSLYKTVRLVRLAADDLKLERIGELQEEVNHEHDRTFFFGWSIKRQYRKAELNAAEAFHLEVTSAFEPVGEDCGTLYDEAAACPKCGAGAVQTTGLRLDLRRAPKSKDISRTIADIEIIVSQRLAERLVDSELTGFDLRPVRHKARYEDDPIDLRKLPIGRQIIEKAASEGFPHGTGSFHVWLNRAENRPLWDQAVDEYAATRRTKARSQGKPAPVWHQLVVTSEPVDIVPPTRAGINPFDDDEKGEFRCPRGDTIGLNLLSELSVSREQFDESESDVLHTRQYVGIRRGLIRPRTEMVVSPRFRQLFLEWEVKGAGFEIAHLK